MVSTLIKHEIRRTLRWYGIIIAGAALIVAFLVLAAWLLPPILNGLMITLAMLVCVGVPTVVPVWMGVDFYRSSYSKTGYLTRALPVRGATIYWVKLGYAYVLSLVAVLIGLALGYLALVGFTVGSGGSVREANDALRVGLRGLAELPWWVTALIVLAAALMPLVWLASYYFAASVGSEAWINKLGVAGPILMWFAFYTVSQIAGVLGIFLPLYLDFTDGQASFIWTAAGLSEIADRDLLPVGVFLGMIAVGIVGILRAKVSFDRLVELR